MITTIGKSFEFSAAHRLPNVAGDHKCARVHGHNYRVEIVCAGSLDARGMVCDYAEIADAWEPLRALFDHRMLNDAPGLENPTAELLAQFILDRLRAALPIVSVRVCETASTWAEVRV